MAKRLDFSLHFSRDFSTTYILTTHISYKYSLSQIFAPSIETLLCKFLFYFLNEMAKRVDFHSTTILLLDYFGKDKTSLRITQLHSIHSTRWPNSPLFPSIFCRLKNQVKNRVVWPGSNKAIYWLYKRVGTALFNNF